MSHVVPEKEKTRRSELLRQAAYQAKLAYRRQFIGKQQQVLIDTIKNDYSKGYGEYYVPIKTKAKLEKNTFYTMHITGIETDGDEPCLIGEVR
jgi:tRNA A37 methylthiotransferase MiaB